FLLKFLGKVTIYYPPSVTARLKRMGLYTDLSPEEFARSSLLYNIRDALVLGEKDFLIGLRKTIQTQMLEKSLGRINSETIKEHIDSIIVKLTQPIKQTGSPGGAAAWIYWALRAAGLKVSDKRAQWGGIA